MLQSPEKFVINFETLLGWFEISEFSEEDKAKCLNFRLLTSDCANAVSQEGKIQFQASTVLNQNPLTVDISRPFDSQKVCFELKSKLGFAS